MAALFRQAGHTVAEQGPADAFVVNTCTVTGTGAHKSRQQIRRVRRENPDAVLAVTGCLAQVDADKLRQSMGEDIDVLIGTKYRDQIVEFVQLARRGIKTDRVDNILRESQYEELTVTHGQSRVRAGIKIQDGCSNFCAYCIIPYARGPVRSRPLTRILEEAQALGEARYAEVVLTGIHLASYGRDLEDGTTLLDVLTALDSVPGIRRIRLGSLEPVVITPAFVEAAAGLSKLCPQFHLSLQSGCDTTLQRMNRHYTTDEYAAAAELLNTHFPDAALTTDVMVGFPGENEEEFGQSLDFCRAMKFAQMHIFPYSPREGTRAASMPMQVPEAEKARRSHEMLHLASHMKATFYRQYVGQSLEVLLEQQKDSFYHATTANYMDVRIAAPEGLQGHICRVTAQSFADGCLYADFEAIIS